MIWTAHPNQVSKICETNPELACFQQRLPYKKRNLDSSPNEPNPEIEHTAILPRSSPRYNEIKRIPPIVVHVPHLSNVRNSVTFPVAWALLALAPLWAADPDISNLLKKVEDRYNRIQTLQVGFQETYIVQGRRRTESGELYLRKPGRMRWEYTNPAGKLFVSDGKNVYFYSPDTNRAEKMKLKETEDMRAPLAFLLGRLDFSKDFKEFQSKPEGGAVSITALPKSDKLPYREVSFTVDETNSRINRLVVTGQDASVLEFTFSGEKLNPPVADAMFRFQVPKGAEFVDETASSQGAQ